MTAVENGEVGVNDVAYAYSASVHDPRAARFARLRESFDDTQVGLLPKPTKKNAEKGRCHECGGWHGLPAVHLDYVGHAAVTSRLLEVDPYWQWEPKAGWDDNGEPRFVRDDQGRPIRLWIDLTVLGVSRPGVGTVEPGSFDAEKQLIGDALRNAAMRFGVALDLWIKGKEEEHAAVAPEPAPPRTYAGADETKAKELGWASLDQLIEVHEQFKRDTADFNDLERADAKAFKEAQGIGWPMSREQFTAMLGAIVTLGQGNDDPEQLENERALITGNTEDVGYVSPYGPGEEPF